MTNKLPPKTLAETWIFLATSNHAEVKESRQQAINKINSVFGSIELCHLYLEQLEKEVA